MSDTPLLSQREKRPPPEPFDFIAFEKAEGEARRKVYLKGLSMYPEEVSKARAYGTILAQRIDDPFDEDAYRAADALTWVWEDVPVFNEPEDPRLVPNIARRADSWRRHMQSLARQALTDGVTKRQYGLPFDGQPIPQQVNRGSKPFPQRYGVSDEGAEHLAAAWMRYLGIIDAEVTKFGNDGGIDVTSSDYIAQVKNYATTRSVGVAAVRELAGVAAPTDRTALFFTSGTYAAGAITFANSCRIHLLRYSALEGKLEGISRGTANFVLLGFPKRNAEQSK